MVEQVKDKSGNRSVFIVLHLVIQVEMHDEVIHGALAVHYPAVIVKTGDNIRLLLMVVIHCTYQSLHYILKGDDSAA